MNHNFNIEIATKYGINEAIMFNHILYWVEYNENNNNNYIDNEYWTFNSYSAFQKWFPYWTERQIRYILDNLIKNKLIKKGSFNTKNYDKTNWYTLDEIGKSIRQKCHIDMTNLSDGYDKNVKPIPNINHIYKPNKNSNNTICATSETEVAPIETKTPTKYKFNCKPSKKNGQTEYILSQEDLDFYIQTYPNLDIDQELRKMWLWLKNNNLKTYSGMGRFISSWLARANDRQPSKKNNQNIQTMSPTQQAYVFDQQQKYLKAKQEQEEEGLSFGEREALRLKRMKEKRKREEIESQKLLDGG